MIEHGRVHAAKFSQRHHEHIAQVMRRTQPSAFTGSDADALTTNERAKLAGAHYIAHAARLALEFWRTGGPKTLARLHTLAEHVGFTYAILSADVERVAIATMWAWEREEVLRPDVGASAMTREEWLTSAVQHLASVFADAGKSLPDVRVSCGFPSKGATSRKQQRVGECWATHAATDGRQQVYISPVIADSVEVLAVLTHELCHAISRTVPRPDPDTPHKARRR